MGSIAGDEVANQVLDFGAGGSHRPDGGVVPITLRQAVRREPSGHPTAALDRAEHLCLDAVTVDQGLWWIRIRPEPRLNQDVALPLQPLHGVEPTLVETRFAADRPNSGTEVLSGGEVHIHRVLRKVHS